MATYSRPGVFINEIPLPQINEPADNGTAIGTFIGAFPKGPVEPTLVSSWTEFVKLYGKSNSAFFAPAAVYSFFANGGRNAYIVRSVGTEYDGTVVTSATASVVLTDAVAEEDGGPFDTIKVSAKTPGTWANDVLSIRIVHGVNDGEQILFSILVFENINGINQLVEQFNDLSMDVDNSRYFESAVNAGSRYIKAERLAYTGALPAATASGDFVALTGGASAVDSAIEETGSVKRVLILGDYETALGLLDVIDNPLVINLPDVAYYFEQGEDSDFEVDQAAVHLADEVLLGVECFEEAEQIVFLADVVIETELFYLLTQLKRFIGPEGVSQASFLTIWSARSHWATVCHPRSPPAAGAPQLCAFVLQRGSASSSRNAVACRCE